MGKIQGIPDTTGPYGAGFGPGEGTGSGIGLERGYSPGGRGFGIGRPGGGFGVPFCQCPNCEFIVKHARGLPCIDTICPKCGNRMIGKNMIISLASYLRNAAFKMQLGME